MCVRERRAGILSTRTLAASQPQRWRAGIVHPATHLLLRAASAGHNAPGALAASVGAENRAGLVLQPFHCLALRLRPEVQAGRKHTSLPRTVAGPWAAGAMAAPPPRICALRCMCASSQQQMLLRVLMRVAGLDVDQSLLRSMASSVVS